jgi:hypothetical protein
LVIAVGVVIAAWRLLPLVTGPWLPSGAVRLHIATEPPNMNTACAAAQLAPARVTAADGELVLVAVETGEPIEVVWPSGFGAWQEPGGAVVADPWGSIVGREGDVLRHLGGGMGSDDAFHICPFGIPTQH